MIKRIIFIALVVILPLLLLGGTVVAYLPCIIDWNTGSFTQNVVLFAKRPTELPIASESRFLYGEINVGARQLGIMLLDGPAPTLWVDANNNGSFIDDGPAECYLRKTKGTQDIYFWKKKVTICYDVDGKEHSNDVLLRFVGTKFGFFGKYTLSYWFSSHREGMLEVSGNIYKVILFTKRTDGDYSVLDDIHFGIDLNLDGKINPSVPSPEVYSAEEVIPIGDENYRILSISPDGAKVVLEAVDEAATFKPFLEVGCKAPAFTVKDLLGREVSIPSTDTKATILVLSSYKPCEISSKNEGNCCNNAFTDTNKARLYQLLHIDYYLKEFYVSSIRIIWLLTGKEYDGLCSENMKWLYVVNDRDMLSLYGYPAAERIFVIDEDGVIRATDEYWIDEKSWLSDYPQGGQLMLTFDDIKAILKDILLQ
ncbi:hypothetical protein AT15_03065 [Kosmotoga arenicorallina S304]|uniref:Thioredoxin domain-containing protein n=1 Tax=Kosmotoga arenicorallina S304 TaxID=1453497 RepID=A0A176K3D4_9BACT|nr:hypothetical protein [Kosmotoga arenicorallina]OAA31825.1 hypothetical protein AT15_03065 [Kosmotoga arenicorallina S304]